MRLLDFLFKGEEQPTIASARAPITQAPTPSKKPAPLFTPQEQAKNREKVKNTLRMYPELFDMYGGVKGRTSGVTSSLRYESALVNGRGSFERLLAEKCTVCLAGISATLFPESVSGGNVEKSIEVALGVPEDLVYLSNWGEDIRAVYDRAYEDHDQREMVEIVCSQIDRVAHRGKL